MRAALTWVGTPFHDCCDVKGHGVDCAMLCVRVFVDLGLVEPFDPRPYHPQWFVHNERSLFIEWLERCGGHRVAAPSPGDVALVKFGKHPAHGAILVDENEMVHAYKPLRTVMRDSRRGLQHRVDSYWSVFP